MEFKMDGTESNVLPVMGEPIFGEFSNKYLTFKSISEANSWLERVVYEQRMHKTKPTDS